MPDAAGKFKGIAVPRIPWKEPVACDACGLELAREEAVEMAVEMLDTIASVYYCTPCASELEQ